MLLNQATTLSPWAVRPVIIGTLAQVNCRKRDRVAVPNHSIPAAFPYTLASEAMLALLSECYRTIAEASGRLVQPGQYGEWGFRAGALALWITRFELPVQGLPAKLHNGMEAAELAALLQTAHNLMATINRQPIYADC